MSGTASPGICPDKSVKTAWNHGCRSGPEEECPQETYRHPIRAHFPMKSSWCLPRVRNPYAEMVLKGHANREIKDRVDAHFSKVICRTDPGEHKQLRRIEGAGCKDHFT